MDLDVNACFIECTGEDDFDSFCPLTPEKHDLPNGAELRWEAYQSAWRSCLSRLRETLVDSVQQRMAKQVIEALHAPPLLGMQQFEMPVVCLHDTTTLSSIISSQLDTCILSHAYPENFGSLSDAMKSIIQGFLQTDPTTERAKQKTTSSLAANDINILHPWYSAICKDRDSPTTVVVLHDFELLPVPIMRDIFYICSRHAQKLPIAFLLVMASPPTPSFIHHTYPRSTLTLLRITHLEASTGSDVFEETLLKTFFDLGFEPDIVLGPTALQHTINYFNQKNSSFDSVMTSLQLAHIKHFTTSPLTCLAGSTPAAADEQADNLSFADALFTRIHAPSAEEWSNPVPPSETHITDWRTETLSNLLSSVDIAREGFKKHARDQRLGFSLLRIIQKFLQGCGYKGLDWPEGALGTMSKVLHGDMSSDLRSLNLILRKLRQEQLARLLQEIQDYFTQLPTTTQEDEMEAVDRISYLVSGQSEEPASKGLENATDWLVEYLQELLQPLDTHNMWDVWYTRRSPFPAETLDPSVRASLLQALRYPQDYSTGPSPDDGDDILTRSPDVTILYKRYAESGRVINVYDWFGSFQVALSAQRKEIEQPKKDKSASPRKSKGKARKQEIEHDEEDEEWNLQVRARFVRALHELDYMGFTKQTGRKADHAQRMVFEPLEYQ